MRIRQNRKKRACLNLKHEGVAAQPLLQSLALHCSDLHPSTSITTTAIHRNGKGHHLQ